MQTLTQPQGAGNPFQESMSRSHPSKVVQDVGVGIWGVGKTQMFQLRKLWLEEVREKLQLVYGTMDGLVWLDCGGQGSGLREMRPGELTSHLINYEEEFA